MQWSVQTCKEETPVTGYSMDQTSHQAKQSRHVTKGGCDSTNGNHSEQANSRRQKVQQWLPDWEERRTLSFYLTDTKVSAWDDEKILAMGGCVDSIVMELARCPSSIYFNG